VAQVRRQLRKRRVRRDDRDVCAVAQLRQQRRQRVERAREEHVAMRDDVRGDRTRTARRVDFSARTLERRDEAPKLVEVRRDREDAPFRQGSPKFRLTISEEAGVSALGDPRRGTRGYINTDRALKDSRGCPRTDLAGTRG